MTDEIKQTVLVILLDRYGQNVPFLKEIKEITGNAE